MIFDKIPVIALWAFDSKIDPGRRFRPQEKVGTGRKEQEKTPFPAGKQRKSTEYGSSIPVSVSGCRFWQVPVDSGRNRINPDTGTVYRNTASVFRRFPVFSCGIQPVFLDLGLTHPNKAVKSEIKKRLAKKKYWMSRNQAIHDVWLQKGDDIPYRW